MDLVDRYRPVQRIDVGRRGSRTRQPFLVEHDRRRARTDFGGKGERIRLQRQMLALPAEDVEFVTIADRGMRDEQLPITEAAHAHRMAQRIPEVEVANRVNRGCLGTWQEERTHPPTTL